MQYPLQEAQKQAAQIDTLSEISDPQTIDHGSTNSQRALGHHALN